MHIKNMIPALVAASLIGAPAIAFAQNEAAQPEAAAHAQGAPRTKAPAAHHKMKTSHHYKAGTTTGMSTSTSKAKSGGQSGY